MSKNQEDMPVTPMPLSRKILYYSIMIGGLLLIIELCSRAYYYQRLSSHPIAALQIVKDLRNELRNVAWPDSTGKKIQRNHYLVRPELSRTENDQIYAETMLADQAVYVPWVQFAFRDVRSRYVNVTDHIRRSVPEISDTTAKTALTIYFLGGSTLYGFNLADPETIPSFFIRAYREKYPQGPPIRVVNLGMPYYFSYQELMLLLDKIFRGQRPDIVVMLDGLNDCLQAGTSLSRSPVFTPGIGKELAKPELPNEMKASDYYKFPAGVSPDSTCASVYRNYIENIQHAREMTRLYGIDLYCFWQPVPYYNYPNASRDPISAKPSQDKRFDKIFPMVKKRAGELDYLFYLGDMLQEERGLPFIDQVHYSPYFNRILAEKMLEKMNFNPVRVP